MAREILFRGKGKETGKWHYGNYLKIDKTTYCFAEDYEANPNNTEHFIVYDEMTDWGLPNKHKMVEVDPKTVGQYTGWNDMHQTKIFENDVIEFVNGITSHRYLIWWHREGNMMTAVPLNGMTFNGSDYWNGNYPLFEYSTFCLMMFDPYGDFRDIRVVGNIHDNPELLEGCKNYGTLDN